MPAGMSPSHTDAWVRHNGREARGQYRAQSADGRYFLLKYNSGHSNSIRWFSADDVDFIRDVEPVITEPSAMVRSRLERQRAATQESSAETGPAEADA